jgi:hypothetical protein
MATVSAPPEGGSDDGTMANMMQSLMGSASATLIGCYAKGTFRMQIVLDGTIALDDTPGDPNKAFLTNFNLQFGFAPVAYVGFGVSLQLQTDQDGDVATTDDFAELTFTGSIQAVATVPPTMKSTLHMEGLWRNAFGNKHFAIGQLGCVFIVVVVVCCCGGGSLLWFIVVVHCCGSLLWFIVVVHCCGCSLFSMLFIVFHVVNQYICPIQSCQKYIKTDFLISGLISGARSP